MDPRQKMINLAAERTQALNAAEAALTAGTAVIPNAITTAGTKFLKSRAAANMP